MGIRRIEFRSKLLGVGLAVTAALVAAQVVAGPPDPKPKPPLSRGSDTEYAQRITAGRTMQHRFVTDFVAQGRDPRSVPRISLPAYGLGPASLVEAVAQAEVIVVGRVEHTLFSPDPFGGTTPLATSQIGVEQVLKGAPTKSLTLFQSGGPMLHSTGGSLAEALIQDDNNELVLSGDDVVLLLQPVAGRPEGFLPLPAAGVLFIKEGRVVPEHSNRFGESVMGKTKAELLAAISQLVRGDP